jgi:hypothetical protein
MNSKHSAKRAGQIPKGEPWIWLTREMLASPAWKAMNRSQRRLVERVMIEHMNHAGTENGNLIVTYTDFREHGIRDKSVRTDIAIAEALGWIEITVKGKASFEDQHYPSRYALTWLPQPSRSRLASNRWREIKTDDAARLVVKDALARREADRDILADVLAARKVKGQTRKLKLKAVA